MIAGAIAGCVMEKTWRRRFPSPFRHLPDTYQAPDLVLFISIQPLPPLTHCSPSASTIAPTASFERRDVREKDNRNQNWDEGSHHRTWTPLFCQALNR